MAFTCSSHGVVATGDVAAVIPRNTMVPLPDGPPLTEWAEQVVVGFTQSGSRYMCAGDGQSYSIAVGGPALTRHGSQSEVLEFECAEGDVFVGVVSTDFLNKFRSDDGHIDADVHAPPSARKKGWFCGGPSGWAIDGRRGFMHHWGAASQACVALPSLQGRHTVTLHAACHPCAPTSLMIHLTIDGTDYGPVFAGLPCTAASRYHVAIAMSRPGDWFHVYVPTSGDVRASVASGEGDDDVSILVSEATKRNQGAQPTPVRILPANLGCIVLQGTRASRGSSQRNGRDSPPRRMLESDRDGPIETGSVVGTLPDGWLPTNQDSYGVAIIDPHARVYRDRHRKKDQSTSTKGAEAALLVRQFVRVARLEGLLYVGAMVRPPKRTDHEGDYDYYDPDQHRAVPGVDGLSSFPLHEAGVWLCGDGGVRTSSAWIMPAHQHYTATGRQFRQGDVVGVEVTGASISTVSVTFSVNGRTVATATVQTPTTQPDQWVCAVVMSPNNEVVPLAREYRRADAVTKRATPRPAEPIRSGGIPIADLAFEDAIQPPAAAAAPVAHDRALWARQVSEHASAVPVNLKALCGWLVCDDVPRSAAVAERALSQLEVLIRSGGAAVAAVSRAAWLVDTLEDTVLRHMCDVSPGVITAVLNVVDAIASSSAMHVLTQRQLVIGRHGAAPTLVGSLVRACIFHNRTRGLADVLRKLPNPASFGSAGVFKALLQAEVLALASSKAVALETAVGMVAAFLSVRQPTAVEDQRCAVVCAKLLVTEVTRAVTALQEGTGGNSELAKPGREALATRVGQLALQLLGSNVPGLPRSPVAFGLAVLAAHAGTDFTAAEKRSYGKPQTSMTTFGDLKGPAQHHFTVAWLRSAWQLQPWWPMRGVHDRSQLLARPLDVIASLERIASSSAHITVLIALAAAQCSLTSDGMVDFAGLVLGLSARHEGFDRSLWAAAQPVFSSWRSHVGMDTVQRLLALMPPPAVGEPAAIVPDTVNAFALCIQGATSYNVGQSCAVASWLLRWSMAQSGRGPVGMLLSKFTCGVLTATLREVLVNVLELDSQDEQRAACFARLPHQVLGRLLSSFHGQLLHRTARAKMCRQVSGGGWSSADEGAAALWTALAEAAISPHGGDETAAVSNLRRLWRWLDGLWDVWDPSTYEFVAGTLCRLLKGRDTAVCASLEKWTKASASGLAHTHRVFRSVIMASPELESLATPVVAQRRWLPTAYKRVSLPRSAEREPCSDWSPPPIPDGFSMPRLAAVLMHRAFTIGASAAWLQLLSWVHKANAGVVAAAGLTPWSLLDALRPALGMTEAMWPRVVAVYAAQAAFEPLAYTALKDLVPPPFNPTRQLPQLLGIHPPKPAGHEAPSTDSGAAAARGDVDEASGDGDEAKTLARSVQDADSETDPLDAPAVACSSWIATLETATSVDRAGAVAELVAWHWNMMRCDQEVSHQAGASRSTYLLLNLACSHPTTIVRWLPWLCDRADVLQCRPLRLPDPTLERLMFRLRERVERNVEWGSLFPCSWQAVTSLSVGASPVATTLLSLDSATAAMAQTLQAGEWTVPANRIDHVDLLCLIPKARRSCYSSPVRPTDDLVRQLLEYLAMTSMADDFLRLANDAHAAASGTVAASTPIFGVVQTCVSLRDAVCEVPWRLSARAGRLVDALFCATWGVMGDAVDPDASSDGKALDTALSLAMWGSNDHNHTTRLCQVLRIAASVAERGYIVHGDEQSRASVTSNLTAKLHAFAWALCSGGGMAPAVLDACSATLGAVLPLLSAGDTPDPVMTLRVEVVSLAAATMGWGSVLGFDIVGTIGVETTLQLTALLPKLGVAAHAHIERWFSAVLFAAALYYHQPTYPRAVAALSAALGTMVAAEATKRRSGSRSVGTELSASVLAPLRAELAANAGQQLRSDPEAATTNGALAGPTAGAGSAAAAAAGGAGAGAGAGAGSEAGAGAGAGTLAGTRGGSAGASVSVGATESAYAFQTQRDITAWIHKLEDAMPGYFDGDADATANTDADAEALVQIIRQIDTPRVHGGFWHVAAPLRRWVVATTLQMCRAEHSSDAMTRAALVLLEKVQLLACGSGRRPDTAHAAIPNTDSNSHEAATLLAGDASAWNQLLRSRVAGLRHWSLLALHVCDSAAMAVVIEACGWRVDEFTRTFRSTVAECVRRFEVVGTDSSNGDSASGSDDCAGEVLQEAARSMVAAWSGPALCHAFVGAPHQARARVVRQGLVTSLMHVTESLNAAMSSVVPKAIAAKDARLDTSTASSLLVKLHEALQDHLHLCLTIIGSDAMAAFVSACARINATWGFIALAQTASRTSVRGVPPSSPSYAAVETLSSAAIQREAAMSIATAAELSKLGLVSGRALDAALIMPLVFSYVVRPAVSIPVSLGLLPELTTALEKAAGREAQRFLPTVTSVVLLGILPHLTGTSGEGSGNDLQLPPSLAKTLVGGMEAGELGELSVRALQCLWRLPAFRQTVTEDVKADLLSICKQHHRKGYIAEALFTVLPLQEAVAAASSIVSGTKADEPSAVASALDAVKSSTSLARHVATDAYAALTPPPPSSSKDGALYDVACVMVQLQQSLLGQSWDSTWHTWGVAWRCIRSVSRFRMVATRAEPTTLAGWIDTLERVLLNAADRRRPGQGSVAMLSQLLLVALSSLVSSECASAIDEVCGTVPTPLLTLAGDGPLDTTLATVLGSVAAMRRLQRSGCRTPHVHQVLMQLVTTHLANRAAAVEGDDTQPTFAHLQPRVFGAVLDAWATHPVGGVLLRSMMATARVASPPAADDDVDTLVLDTAATSAGEVRIDMGTQRERLPPTTNAGSKHGASCTVSCKCDRSTCCTAGELHAAWGACEAVRASLIEITNELAANPNRVDAFTPRLGTYDCPTGSHVTRTTIVITVRRGGTVCGDEPGMTVVHVVHSSSGIA